MGFAASFYCINRIEQFSYKGDTVLDVNFYVKPRETKEPSGYVEVSNLSKHSYVKKIP